MVAVCGKWRRQKDQTIHLAAKSVRREQDNPAAWLSLGLVGLPIGVTGNPRLYLWTPDLCGGIVPLGSKTSVYKSVTNTFLHSFRLLAALSSWTEV